MNTEKLLVLVIFGILHCIINAITLAGPPQYEVKVMISGFINPSQRNLAYCDDSGCFYACCDGYNSTSSLCRRQCDSFFTYCLRKFGTLTAGCPEGGNIVRSDTNIDDRSIDFSQNTVLGLDNPLIFQGINDTWNGVQLYVRIWDQDPGDNELIDVVRWNIIQPVGVPSGIMNLTGLFNLVTMEVNVTVYCVAGFTGMMCEEDIDDCVGVSCSGNGQCVDGVNSFTCNCTFGFIGVLCNETNSCVNLTCNGRGLCATKVASYVCDCDAGFTGENCEINIDDCLLNPCSEQGQCVNGVDSFICVCNPGFTGELCQINIDDYSGSHGTEVDEVRQSISVIPLVCGAIGALILILTLTLLVIITLKCVFSSKHFSQGVSKCYDSQTQKEMNENEVYGVSIAAPEPKEQPQVLESVSMSTNICYATVTIQKQL